ncbi:hypothetical protein D3C87_1864770 [compost metagenome]
MRQLSDIDKALDVLAAIARWGSGRRGRLSRKERRILQHTRQMLCTYQERRPA